MLSTFTGLPGDYFGWMVKDNNFCYFPQPSGWQSPTNFHCMNLLSEPRQPENLPACINSGSSFFSASMALPGSLSPGILSSTAEQTNEAHGMPQCLHSCAQTIFPSINPCLDEIRSPFTCLFSGRATPTAMPISSQKRLLVFDQSGNQTQLVYDSVYPPVQNPTTTISNLFQKELAVNMEQLNPSKLVFHEDSDENHVKDEGGDMHEDTEELNALLYSDYGDCSDDDSVMSTDHSPFAIRGSYDKQEQVKEMTEVASATSPNKRQKLLDGGYNKSSKMNNASSAKVEGSQEYDDDDAESSYANGQNPVGKVGYFLGKMQSRKDKIRGTLRILESIIPGAKGKDPVVVLDEAIDYLKCLKLKAEARGVNNY
ncbi:hypothetical protein CFOL_v3_23160 [Cephalotus follicularis]|uniref:BHLH domain-containing protein n=1 Tax=Cephalotus follicularis TaxID=3775 RepID=A0A1Q3CHK1_CEPFO|nr:hypothetical protein CFOL_v3_23160 [Cephalotus follicularis]